MCLDVIRELICNGRMQAGEIAPEESIRQIEGRWAALGRLPTLREVVWLQNTPLGDRLASPRA